MALLIVLEMSHNRHSTRPPFCSTLPRHQNQSRLTLSNKKGLSHQRPDPPRSFIVRWKVLLLNLLDCATSSLPTLWPAIHTPQQHPNYTNSVLTTTCLLVLKQPRWDLIPAGTHQYLFRSSPLSLHITLLITYTSTETLLPTMDIDVALCKCDIRVEFLYGDKWGELCVKNKHSWSHSEKMCFCLRNFRSFETRPNMTWRWPWNEPLRWTPTTWGWVTNCPLSTGRIISQLPRYYGGHNRVFVSLWRDKICFSKSCDKKFSGRDFDTLVCSFGRMSMCNRLEFFIGVFWGEFWTAAHSCEILSNYALYLQHNHTVVSYEQYAHPLHGVNFCSTPHN